jgi:hypothetical protein
MKRPRSPGGRSQRAPKFALRALVHSDRADLFQTGFVSFFARALPNVIVQTGHAFGRFRQLLIVWCRFGWS